jgi:hypothetical protein
MSSTATGRPWGEMDADARALSFLGRPLPPAFTLLAVTVAPGAEHDVVATQWHDALVVVERGAIELDGTDGSRAAFATGAVLFLAGLPVRALCNRGAEPAVLVAVRRR